MIKAAHGDVGGFLYFTLPVGIQERKKNNRRQAERLGSKKRLRQGR